MANCRRKYLDSHLFVIFILLLTTVLVRLPFVYLSVIDWDESTFILMGQNLLDGHLPYTDFWDLKPPLAFVSFALLIGLFGDSIEGVRVGGMLWVFLAGVLVYLTGNRLWGRLAGALAGIVSVVFVSVAASGQAVMTETIAVVPLMAAAYLASDKVVGAKQAFWIAFFLSVATLIRLNLAYPAVVVFLHILAITLLSRSNDRLRTMLLFGLGGLLPLLLVSVPYLVNGYAVLYIKSMVQAPLVYSTVQFSLFDNLVRHVREEWDLLKAPLWLAAFGGVGLLLFEWRAETDRSRQSLYLLASFFLATLFSILKSGAAWGHYLIQILPLAALPAGLFYARVLACRPQKLMPALVAVVLLFAATPVISQYVRIAKIWNTGQSLYATDSGHVLADVLRALNPAREPIYLTTHHIAYWLTETRPVSSPVIHPSNLGRTYLLMLLTGKPTTAVDALRNILEQRPRLIVKKARVSFLIPHPKAEALLNHMLKSSYRMVAKVGDIYIYELVES